MISFLFYLSCILLPWSIGIFIFTFYKFSKMNSFEQSFVTINLRFETIAILLSSVFLITYYSGGFS